VIYLRKIIINIYIMDKKIEKNRLLTRIRSNSSYNILFKTWIAIV